MSVLLRSFLWSLAVVLSVGLMVSWLDAPTALAQDGAVHPRSIWVCPLGLAEKPVGLPGRVATTLNTGEIP